MLCVLDGKLTVSRGFEGSALRLSCGWGRECRESYTLRRRCSRGLARRLGIDESWRRGDWECRGSHGCFQPLQEDFVAREFGVRGDLIIWDLEGKKRRGGENFAEREPLVVVYDLDRVPTWQLDRKFMVYDRIGCTWFCPSVRTSKYLLNFAFYTN